VVKRRIAPGQYVDFAAFITFASPALLHQPRLVASGALRRMPEQEVVAMTRRVANILVE
jgi:hypothetical protein